MQQVGNPGWAPQRRPGDTAIALVGLCLGLLIGLAVAFLRPAAPNAGRDGDATTGAAEVRVAGATQLRADSGWNDGDWSDSGVSGATAIVRVENRRCGDVISGSGVIVDGVVLTDRHVVAGAVGVEITTSDGRRRAAQHVAVSDRLDLAVLRADGLDAGLGLASETRPGAMTLAGFPGGSAFRARTVRLEPGPTTLTAPHPVQPWRLDAEVVPGESGSALVDAAGEVAALVYAREEPSGRGLAIDAADLAAERGRVVRQPPAVC